MRGRLLTADRLGAIALGWCIAALAYLVQHLAGQARVGWTDGVDRPFGEDFINFWSAARLAASGAVAAIYEIEAFHAFQVGVVGAPIDLYHYSYPPTLLLLTAPFALFPYPLAWALWQGLGWLAFARALRRWLPRGWLLLALAWPAVLVNAVSGQAGAWIAAIIGWGLILLPRRPLLAGLVFSLLTVKPQLFWLLPVALLAGREWRALAGVAIGAAGLITLATLCFGVDSWAAYAEQAALLKRVILEDGTGVWHRMVSVFVLVRHGGGSVASAYAAQALVSIAVAALVALAWHRRVAAKECVLTLGLIAGSLYVSDYDCVLLAFSAAWLWSRGAVQRGWVVLLAAIPLVAAPVALASGTALGAMLLWPVLLAMGRAGLLGASRPDRPRPVHATA
ncbi:Protein of unknown function [Sphingomonas guangdongensis]|uniref:DUF2029 domain-containing protein n=1 Tax=Sphingomonas guangdongensis TaxID=1141890 RepID=A0A285QXU9_9SPHN|nr:glycosyltransferase family 87 protein [Sphingomonas guangdongensis]SOB86651.1 Protein of unknown function [Sphingomonas guangdongensis]